MSGFKIDGTNLMKNLTERQIKISAASKLFAQSAGNELEAEAKVNAPWKDGPFRSRQSIESYVKQPGNKTDIILRGNTPHFKYLELCHEKKYEILWPTVKKNMSRVVKAWAKKAWK